jgi:hypothetical protein
MRFAAVIAFGLGLLAMTSTAGGRTGTLDQASVYGNTSFNTSASTLTWQQ